nr:CaiB/BaiF CoA-transferase family protein [Bacillus pseudomycoides]
MMLKGITVVDFSHYLPGPYAALRLADLGAEVIKVEPLYGDLARGLESGNQAFFYANNRNKKSIAINVKHPEGVAVVKKLLQKSDVLIESFRPNVMNRLGLGYEEVKRINKSIIYTSLTGYGQNKEHSDLASHDINFMAVSGVLAQLKDQEGIPVHPKITLGDEIGGMMTSEKIMAALFQRERTGEGSYLDISLTDSLMMLMNNHIMLEKMYNKRHGLDLLSGKIVCYSLYETSDERFVALGAVEQKFWHSFCEAVGRVEWGDKQYELTQDGQIIYEKMKALFASKPLAYWTKFAMEVDCCLAPVLETNELSSSPFTRHLVNEKGYVFTHTSHTFANPPKLGEHTEEVLQKLGLSQLEIERLEQLDVIERVRV